MTASGTESRVCEDIAMRQWGGIAKYGTTVADNPLALRAWMQHAYEECLDQAVYLKRAMEEMDRQPMPAFPSLMTVAQLVALEDSMRGQE